MSHFKQILAQILLANASSSSSSSSSHSSSLALLLSFAATSPLGDVRVASLLFDRIAPRHRSAFSYNSMIRGLAGGRLPDQALRIYLLMVRDGFAPDGFTFPFVLKACSLLVAVEAGEALHAKILRLGFALDPYVLSGLIRMYSEFDEVATARQLFDEAHERDVVLWNSMIGSYAKCGDLEAARYLFDVMTGKNVGTYNALLAGYAKFGCLDVATKLFEEIPQRDIISWNTMIGAHARSGSVALACALFDRAPQKNVATWSAMISGFAQSNNFVDALGSFNEMLAQGAVPNQSILVSVLSCCAHLGALEQGIWIHAYLERQKFEVDDMLGSSIIDMYVKCGMLQGALPVFDRLNCKDVCSWTSMIYGFAMHGHSEKALETFRQMERLQLKPNDVTILAVLCACSHSGLVDQGREIFNQMHQVYGITPKVEHYTCMVDILSRGNLIDEALDLIKSMPMQADVFIWGALFGGLRANELNEIPYVQELMANIANLEPKGSGAYVLASNIYSAIDRWDDAAGMRSMMDKIGVKKSPGCSLIEIDGIVHEFLANGMVHVDSEYVYDMLERINRSMKLDCFT